MTIFGTYAPFYWAKGLPVIPLLPREKKPFLASWQNYCLNMPTHMEQEHWLRNFPHYNMGLPLGPQSGLVVVDVDTDDETIQNLIYSLLPHTPWVRIGRKGCALAYKINGHKARKVTDSQGRMIVEFLAKGNQIVLPPSIHPDTKLPYEANCNLYEVLDDLPELPENIEETIRNALTRAGVELARPTRAKVTEFVSSGSRDVKMTQVAGMFASGVSKGELTLAEAMDRLRAWHAACCQSVAGDDIDVEKGVRHICSFLANDVLGPKKKILPVGWDAGLTPQQKQDMGVDFAEEQEEWNFEKARNYLMPILSIKDDNKVAMAVNYALLRISRSPNMDSLSVDRTLIWINKNMPDYKLSGMRKRLKELQAGEMAGNDHTEIALAVIEDLKRIGKYRHHQSCVWHWGGSHWEKILEAEISAVIAQEYGHFPAARRASDHAGILKIIKTLLPQGLSDDPEKENSRYVNFANGVLDANLHLQPHDPDYAATHTLPFRYLPGKELSDAPLFHNFLKSVWGADRDYAQKVTALRDVMCMTLFGMGPSFARVVLLYGVAQSGKTQLLRIMENLMPNEAISRVPPYEFDARFRSARLAQSLMNVCGELSERKQIDGAKFKDFVDGGITDGEIKGKDFFQFAPKCTHWFSSNHLPKTQDSSDGFTRRWAVFTFERMLMSDERVRDLGQTIADAEREEIASWVAGAFPRLKTMGDLELPESHFKVITEMSAENDTVAFWYTAEGLRASPLPEWALKKPTLFHPSAAERGDLGKLKAHSLTDLYAHYSAFCIAQSGLKQVGKRRFSLRLRELGALKRFRMIPRLAEDVIDVLIYGIEGDSL